MANHAVRDNFMVCKIIWRGVAPMKRIKGFPFGDTENHDTFTHFSIMNRTNTLCSLRGFQLIRNIY